MKRQTLLKTSEVSVLHAVETLTKISEMGFEGIQVPEMPTQSSSASQQATPILMEAIEWLHEKNAEKVIKLVREDFHVILEYLRKFDAGGEGILVDPQTLEGMKAIMLVASDAADKVDNYVQLFVPKMHGILWHSLKETKEYQDLIHFYQRKIAPIAEKEAVVQLVANLPIGQLLQASIGKAQSGPMAIEHHVVDLEALRKDSEYDLLFIRREDGSRFFSPKLLRTLKLICHFEEAPGGPKQGEVFRDISLWNDAQLRLLVKTWTQLVWTSLDHFFQTRGSALDHELVSKCSNMAMALMLAYTHSRTVPLSPVKGVREYLSDFHQFLHEVISSVDFGRLIADRPKNERSWDLSLYQLTHEIAWVLYTSGRLSKDLFNLHEALIQQTQEFTMEVDTHSTSGFSGHIWDRYNRLQSAVREFVTEPLVRDIHSLELDYSAGFDPFSFTNYPFKAFDLSWKNSVVPIYRLPFPVHQERIDKVSISNEFKAFLRSVESKKAGKVMVINLQNCTSWKESARCMALHDLAHVHEFKNILIPITFNRDGDFYKQVGVDSEGDELIDSFFSRLKDAITSVTLGYILPDLWQKNDFVHFVDLLLDVVQDGFLYEKDILTKADKLEVIDIVQQLLFLKAIDDFKPSYIYVTCKDGIDVTLPFLSELYYFIKSLNGRVVTEAEEQYLATLLFAPSLLVRGRTIFPERFQRFLSVVRFLERWQNDATDEVRQKLFGSLKLLIPSECYQGLGLVPTPVVIKEREE